MRCGRLRMATAFAAGVIVVAVVIAGCASSAPTPRTSPAHRSTGLDVAGYVVPWDSRSSIGAGGGVLAEVNPVWFQPNQAGAVVYTPDVEKSSTATVTSHAAQEGVVLAPSISNFVNGRWDGALVAAIIADPARRSDHVAAITNLVRSHHWAAIDIDYESLPATSRAAFSAFITELAAALHRVPANLSLTVHAKTSEPGDWAGAQAQDWRALGAAADEVRVMAYDFSNNATAAGPIAPVPWVGQVLRLATALIPLKKIVLGLPTYGYDWSDGAATSDLQWADASALAHAHHTTPQWDAASSSPWFRYRDDHGRSHTVWYANARSLAAELALARRDGVSRFVLWRLGGEDPAIWPILRGQQ